MNSKDQEESSGTTESARKRVAAKKLIEKYYQQLTEGCGNQNCSNERCVSSGKQQRLKPEDAALQAFRYFVEQAPLCEAASSSNPAKMARIPSEDGSIASGDTKENTPPSGAETIEFLTEEKLLEIIEKCQASGSYTLLIRTIGQIFSSEQALKRSFRRIISVEECTKEEIRSMEIDRDKDVDSTASSEGSGCCDGGAGSQAPTLEERPPSAILDVDAIRRAYAKLFAIPDHPFLDALVNAIDLLCDHLHIQVRYCFSTMDDSGVVDIIVMLMELPMLETPDFFPSVLPKLCGVVSQLLVRVQAKLVRTWSKWPPSRFLSMVHALQQLITSRVIEGDFNRQYTLNNDNVIASATRFLQIFYCAAVLGGDIDACVDDCDSNASDTGGGGAETSIGGAFGVFRRPSLASDDSGATGETNASRISGGGVSCGAAGGARVGSEQQSVSEGGASSLLPPGGVAGNTTTNSSSRESTPVRSAKENSPFVKETVLWNELGVRPMDCRKPVIPFEEFYNELLSDQIETYLDYAQYKMEDKFSFLNYPFILTPAVKAMGLYYDNRVRMYSEGRISALSTYIGGNPSNPYLRLKVRRDHIVDDTLIGLEMVALENPWNLKKQLVVEFEGEQGIDEGGVSKEFFQLITEELFNPDYAMFTLNEETQTYWFNPTSFESDAQFTLIGIIVGLAIYNNVILDVRFPMVTYRKLMGKRGTYHDLFDWNPTLARGLHQLLVYDGSDIEEVFCQSFRVSYTDVFGTVLSHDLKADGENALVNQDNKLEFVDLYADFLLNKSVEKQFRAFRYGFTMVTGDSPLKALFRPEEVELLVCGSKHFDFVALEQSAEYDGGYTPTTPIVTDFWSLVHEMSHEQKRQLLQFSTGSDRVPVGGLAKLKFIIARNGPDSDRLPAAHTCFNVLLLPEYSSKEKLKERLLKAITYSKGFGMF